MKYILDSLPYSYDALEPVMDKETLQLHYSKHHQAYVDNLNALVQNLDLNYSLSELLLNLDNLPKEIQASVRNNGGGHYNHTLFWKMLSTEKNQLPTGNLLNIIRNFFIPYF